VPTAMKSLMEKPNGTDMFFTLLEANDFEWSNGEQIHKVTG
jgi:hypothetical protein